jgi:response regulator RpfG family c-di-GMP phosphodiesterase
MNKALLHNDDTGMKKALLRALDAWGYAGIEIDAIRSVYVATTLEVPDVIIIGASTVTTENLEALRQIKADPATNSIPVIILNGRDDPNQEHQRIWRQNGAFDCLSSPWTLQDLRSRLQAALGGFQ